MVSRHNVYRELHDDPFHDLGISPRNDPPHNDKAYDDDSSTGPLGCSPRKQVSRAVTPEEFKPKSDGRIENIVCKKENTGR